MKKVKSYTNLTPEIAEKIIISYATEKQCISIARILNDLGFKVYEFDEILSHVDNMDYDCFIWNTNIFVQDLVMSYKDKDKTEISYDKFMEFINGKPLSMTYTTNDEIDPFGEEDWGHSIQESMNDETPFHIIVKKSSIKFKNLTECQEIAKKLTEMGYVVYNYERIMKLDTFSFMNDQYSCFNFRKNEHFTRSQIIQKDSLTYEEFFSLLVDEKKLKINKNPDIDPFEEEDWGFSVQESNTEKVEGEIKIEDYTSTWDNIFKTRYRNLKNGEVKDIRTLFEGPVAMLYDGLRLFNGGDDIDISFIHYKHNDYVKITPFKNAIQMREDELRTSTNVWRNNLLKTEIREYKEKAFRFPMSMKIVLLEVSKLSDFIFDHLSEMKDVILLGTGVYEQPVHFNMNDFDRIYYNTEPPSLIFMSKDENEVAFDLLKPIKYKQIVKKIVNTEIDPWGEEDWDDSLFEIKLLNFAEYNLNEMMKL